MLWDVFSVLGLICATVYRAPQIYQLYKTKKAEDINIKSYLVQSSAYVFLLIYLVGSGKALTETVLCAYYLVGLVQNFIIYTLKQKYKTHTDALEQL